MMVLEEHHNRVVGLVTSRDLLRIAAAGFKEGEKADDIVNRIVGDFMTPISQVVYARPEESVGICRTIMAKLGIKCLPVLSRAGRVEGLVTARDMSDYGLSAKDKGGKETYLNDISERVGLSSNTSMAEPPTYMKAHLALEQAPLFANLATSLLPHPFKTEHGIGWNLKGIQCDLIHFGGVCVLASDAVSNGLLVRPLQTWSDTVISQSIPTYRKTLILSQLYRFLTKKTKPCERTRTWE